MNAVIATPLPLRNQLKSRPWEPFPAFFPPFLPSRNAQCANPARCLATAAHRPCGQKWTIPRVLIETARVLPRSRVLVSDVPLLSPGTLVPQLRPEDG